MMDMQLNSGKFVIDDNNNIVLDKTIAKEIEKEFLNNEDNKDKEIPNFNISD